jgi:hypothetical protein
VTDRVQLHPTDTSRVSDDPRRRNLPFHAWYSAGKGGLANHAITVGASQITSDERIRTVVAGQMGPLTMDAGPRGFLLSGRVLILSRESDGACSGRSGRIRVGAGVLVLASSLGRGRWRRRSSSGPSGVRGRTRDDGGLRRFDGRHVCCWVDGK